MSGIWQLGAGVSASFFAATAAVGAGLSVGSALLQGIAAVGAVNSFMAKKRGKKGSGRRRTVKKVLGSALSLGEMLQLIHDNNQARDAGGDDATVLCQSYKESRFRPKAINGSHRGLLQVNPAAAKGGGLGNGQARLNPAYYTNIFDPAQNIRTGTRYLAVRIGWAGGDLTNGLEGFGTGPGYADDILGCSSWVRVGLLTESVFGSGTGRMFIDEGLHTIK